MARPTVGRLRSLRPSLAGERRLVDVRPKDRAHDRLVAPAGLGLVPAQHLAVEPLRLIDRRAIGSVPVQDEEIRHEPRRLAPRRAPGRR